MRNRPRLVGLQLPVLPLISSSIVADAASASAAEGFQLRQQAPFQTNILQSVQMAHQAITMQSASQSQIQRQFPIDPYNGDLQDALRFGNDGQGQSGHSQLDKSCQRLRQSQLSHNDQQSPLFQLLSAFAVQTIVAAAKFAGVKGSFAEQQQCQDQEQVQRQDQEFQSTVVSCSSPSSAKQVRFSVMENKSKLSADCLCFLAFVQTVWFVSHLQCQLVLMMVLMQASVHAHWTGVLSAANRAYTTTKSTESLKSLRQGRGKLEDYYEKFIAEDYDYTATAIHSPAHSTAVCRLVPAMCY